MLNRLFGDKCGFTALAIMNMLPMPMHQLKDFDSNKSMTKDIDDFMKDVYDGKISSEKPSAAKNDTKTWNKHKTVFLKHGSNFICTWNRKSSFF